MARPELKSSALQSHTPRARRHWPLRGRRRRRQHTRMADPVVAADAAAEMHQLALDPVDLLR